MQLPPGIKPGSKEWGEAALAIRQSRFAVQARNKAKLPDDALPLAVVAAALGRNQSALRSSVSLGRIPAFHLGCRIYLRPSDVAQPIKPTAKALAARSANIKAYNLSKALSRKKVGNESDIDASLSDGQRSAQQTHGAIDEASEDVPV